MKQIYEIVSFMLAALGKSWPFLVLSIPLSVAVNLSGAGKRVGALIGRRPAVSILLATLLGALSPLCSCTVIPVIFGLLTAGVPLGPVMAFWIASPSMDPEIFFLSVTTLGWNLAVWRLVSTFLLSLGAGFAAHLLVRRGYFAGGILRDRPSLETVSIRSLLRSRPGRVRTENGAEGCGCASSAVGEAHCCSSAPAEPLEEPVLCCSDGEKGSDSLGKRILRESGKSLLFVGKFLLIAYLLEALISLYVPQKWIMAALGGKGALAVGVSTLFGLPFYTSNLAALGLLGGLLEKGMVPAAALAFLISGPTTTLPAMSAVFGIAKPRVFRFYLAVSFLGALAFGGLYLIAGA